MMLFSPMNVEHNLKKSYGRREVAERFVRGTYRAGLKPLQPLPLLTSKVISILLHVGKKLRLSNTFPGPGGRSEAVVQICDVLFIACHSGWRKESNVVRVTFTGDPVTKLLLTFFCVQVQIWI